MLVLVATIFDMHFTEFLDEEVHNEERTIQYIVRDQVGALGNTLQIISVSISDFIKSLASSPGSRTLLM